MKNTKDLIYKTILYALLMGGALIALFPFYWMFIISTNPNHVVNSVPPAFLPGNMLVDNFKNVLANIDFFGALWNSIIVSTSITLATLLFCSLAGYAFAKLEFKGKKILFIAILTTMMIPPQLGLIPSYVIITKLGWLNELKAVIVPGMVSAFGIFWMRQYIKEAIPNELIEAGKMDGCSQIRIYFQIVIPLILPAFATLGIITYMGVWNDFLWPLIVLKDQSVHTLQIAIRSLNDTYVRDYGMIMSGTFWATVPLVLIFLIFNKFFIDSIVKGAVKN
ncbi:sugar ABC transporter ATP-binding protein [Halolactibacillus alkaliphilus]|uniref:Sugar ABC transporter ATP-binding protein n=1 Tax=Halolactibacillus alkaliphilus TaxID=442899 RepID=A0A511WZU0_9BACI|nr:carbohydrate ABC transporter permease [Halolactibacillus alkaliphilus]GEN56200.1 sugar ABC transporter ATP-binding protein [Halolactibacillus alkaliphilus]GGN66601.1 sugar ABC transporter ATP-binding protein [Halolactibacillus alkaliphilus]SFO67987.1 carbohydrate ABC transporter membrane protein 2, CUT1 family (TC 3.A.1.1.-) [Halolactibacillus alkaliphilus]